MRALTVLLLAIAWGLVFLLPARENAHKKAHKDAKKRHQKAVKKHQRIHKESHENALKHGRDARKRKESVSEKRKHQNHQLVSNHVAYIQPITTMPLQKKKDESKQSPQIDTPNMPSSKDANKTRNRGTLPPSDKAAKPSPDEPTSSETHKQRNRAHQMSWDLSNPFSINDYTKELRLKDSNSDNQCYF
jgi:FtsZ-interacting cell division protein ZipA